MNYEQIMQALQALSVFEGDVNLRMRKPGDWYVNCFCERIEDSVLSGGLVSAVGPEKALEDFWAWATDTRYELRIRTRSGPRKVKWNGFMWEDRGEIA